MVATRERGTQGQGPTPEPQRANRRNPDILKRKPELERGGQRVTEIALARFPCHGLAAFWTPETRLRLLFRDLVSR